MTMKVRLCIASVYIPLILISCLVILCVAQIKCFKKRGQTNIDKPIIRLSRSPYELPYELPSYHATTNANSKLQSDNLHHSSNNNNKNNLLLPQNHRQQISRRNNTAAFFYEPNSVYDYVNTQPPVIQPIAHVNANSLAMPVTFVDPRMLHSPQILPTPVYRSPVQRNSNARKRDNTYDEQQIDRLVDALKEYNVMQLNQGKPVSQQNHVRDTSRRKLNAANLLLDSLELPSTVTRGDNLSVPSREQSRARLKSLTSRVRALDDERADIDERQLDDDENDDSDEELIDDFDADPSKRRHAISAPKLPPVPLPPVPVPEKYHSSQPSIKGSRAQQQQRRERFARPVIVAPSNKQTAVRPVKEKSTLVAKANVGQLPSAAKLASNQTGELQTRRPTEYPVSEQVSNRLDTLSQSLDRYFNDGFFEKIEKKGRQAQVDVAPDESNEDDGEDGDQIDDRHAQQQHENHDAYSQNDSKTMTESRSRPRPRPNRRLGRVKVRAQTGNIENGDEDDNFDQFITDAAEEARKRRNKKQQQKQNSDAEDINSMRTKKAQLSSIDNHDDVEIDVPNERDNKDYDDLDGTSVNSSKHKTRVSRGKLNRQKARKSKPPLDRERKKDRLPVKPPRRRRQQHSGSPSQETRNRLSKQSTKARKSEKKEHGKGKKRITSYVDPIDGEAMDDPIFL